MKKALIIGQGIGGTLLSYTLYSQGMDIDVADNIVPKTASKIASGLYNPLVLKRRRVVWHAHPMIQTLNQVYPEMERLTQSSFFHHQPIWEIIPDIATENDWSSLGDKPLFEPFIGSITREFNPSIKAQTLGEVRGSGRVDTEEMIQSWSSFLQSKNAFYNAKVLPTDLSYSNDAWHWNGQAYENIIWCEGYHDRHPHFEKLPFSPTRGEVLVVRSPSLKLEHMIHSSMFIIPLGNDLYKVGATYAWDDTKPRTTIEGRQKILDAWDKMVDAPGTVVEHLSGVRPNVQDRKPILGKSNKVANSYIFNGLGSRGILMAPWLAQCFSDFLEGKDSLPNEVDFTRFLH